MQKELLTINNLGMSGINSDLDPWSLPAEFITEGSNFRISADKIISIGASELWSTPPVESAFDATLFNGVDSFIKRSANFTGQVDTRVGLLSFQFEYNGLNADSEYEIYTNNQVTFRVFIDSDSSNNAFLNITVNSFDDPIIIFRSSQLSTGLHSVVASWDISILEATVYIDDISHTIGTINNIAEDIFYDNQPHIIGSKTDEASDVYHGCLSEYWFSSDHYLDLDIESNRRLFFDALGSVVNKGTDGSTPVGVSPVLYLSNPFDSFEINNGTGGGFLVNGTLLECPQAIIFSNGSIHPGYLLPVLSPNNKFWLIASRSRVDVFDGSNWSTITSANGYAGLSDGDEFDWTGCMLGSIPIINHPLAEPEYWSPQSGSQILQPLDFSPGVSWSTANRSFQVLRSHKNFLFALNLVENGAELPSSYRWSHPADNNGLPFTWDETDLSSIASIEQIGGNSGSIIDGFSLRDSFCIYSERGIDILDQSGDEFIFRRRRLSSTIGLINKNCIAEIKGVHFFLGDGDIFKNDGNSIDSIVHNRIRRRLNSQVNEKFIHRAFVLTNTTFKEVWFCIPEGSSEVPNTAYVYNWKDDSWAIRALPNNIAFADYGFQSDSPGIWSAELGTWASKLGTWGAGGKTPSNDTVIGVDTSDSSLIILDPSDSGQSGDISASIERVGFPLGSHVGNVSISRVYPHMDGSQPVNIQVGSQQYAGSPVNWKNAISFNPELDRKIDIRTTGELFCWRISSIGAGNWSISGMDVEFTKAGAR